MSQLALWTKLRNLLRRGLRRPARNLGEPQHSIPLAHMRDLVPAGPYELADRYLLTESRLRRRETTVHPYFSEVGDRTIEVDFSLPTSGKPGDTYYVPLAFFRKNEVSPSLEARDAENRILALPTKRENMALTELGVRRLLASGQLTFADQETSLGLLQEVIRAEPFPARISRLLLRGREPQAEPIFDLLHLLEDHFVLWAPIQGDPASQHHVTICRSEPRSKPSLVARWGRRVRSRPLDTAMGPVFVGYEVPGWLPKPLLSLAMARLLSTFALRPIEAGVDESEASRFASCHLRFRAPDGFLVRNLRVGAVQHDEGERDEMRELDPADPDSMVQGCDQNVGHVHLSRTVNPQRIYLNVSLGLRGGITTLWMLATVLTAVLLWLVEHHSSYGPPVFQNKQITAAALLVGPAFASAWSLRAEAGELLRTSLAGARVLLLTSAALSVATALALAGFLPLGADRYDTISIYATVSFFIAVALTTAWLISSRPTWQLFRSVLYTQARNLFAIFLLGLFVLLLGRAEDLPIRITGLLLLLVGIGLAAITANTAAEPLRGSRTWYRPIATIGALPVIFAAGYFLGFYTNRFDPDLLRGICVGVGMALIVLTACGFPFAPRGEWEEHGNQAQKEEALPKA